MVVEETVTIVVWLRASNLFPNLIYSKTVYPQTRRCLYQTETFNSAGVKSFHEFMFFYAYLCKPWRIVEE